MYEQNMEGNFMLVTTARAVIHDNFIDTSGSSLNTSVSEYDQHNTNTKIGCNCELSMYVVISTIVHRGQFKSYKPR